ncbi:MAG: hypothetical protein ACE5FQ_00965 [Thiogranum sp.]
MDNLQVIYVAGSGRSGTTILDRVLGTLDGVTSFNEIYCLLTDGLRDNDRCACGTRFNDCDFWRDVLDRVLDGPDDITRIRNLYDRFDHMQQFLRIFLGAPGDHYRKQLDEYRTWLGKLYFTLAEKSGNRIIIDSSKVPTRALILNQVDGIDVHVVHLVRDVRAVVYAWQKEKYNPAYESRLPTYATLRTVRFWYARNLTSELLGRRMPYVRFIYEDFVRNPQSALPHLTSRLAPLADKRFSFLEDGSIRLDALHSIGGNPDRFTTGPVKLRLDTAWVDKLSPGARRMATLASYPLLARYGFTGPYSPRQLAGP